MPSSQESSATRSLSLYGAALFLPPWCSLVRNALLLYQDTLLGSGRLPLSFLLLCMEELALVSSTLVDSLSKQSLGEEEDIGLLSYRAFLCLRKAEGASHLTFLFACFALSRG